MSIDSSELTYQLACENIEKIRQRYTQANASKSFWSRMVSSSDLRLEQILKLESLVAGIKDLTGRYIGLHVLTDEFNLSAVRGCYYSILNEIQSTYKKKPEDFINSKLVKILLSDLKLDELPSESERQKDMDNYQQALGSINIVSIKQDVSLAL